jgi:4-hydroxybenzoate polyprenyltransferase
MHGLLQPTRPPVAGDADRTATGQTEATLRDPRPSVSAWWRALRPLHWAKNLLVFLAPALGMQLLAWPTARGALILFVAMGCMASAGYIVNDIIDIPADRAHSRKRLRPFASGEIPIAHGAVAAGMLAAAGLGLGLLLPRAALLALVAYPVMTLAYSLVFKRQPIIDVVILAGLYTLRVLAGGLVPAAPISPWLLTFAMFFFLGLAMVKRYAELERVAQTGGGGVAARGYTEKDLPLLLATGVASSFGAIIIFMIYLITDQYPRQIYKHPSVLWAMLPLFLVWVLRVWHLAVRGRMHEDPVVFALKDAFSLVVGAILVGVLLVAWS